MKLIIRNFVSTMKYYRQSSLFNVVGLSLAFMACYIIYVQTAYEFGFGKVHNDYERIHRVNITVHNSSIGTGSASTPLLKKQMINSPIIEHTTIIESFSRSNMKYDTDSGKELSDYKLIETDTCLNDVFDFDMTTGHFDDIAVAGNVVIPLSLAELVWSSAESAINQNLYSVSDKVYNVVGVYRDFSKQSVIDNHVYEAPGMNYDEFEGLNCNQYFKVVKNTTDSDIDNMLKAMDRSDAFVDIKKMFNFSFGHTPLKDVYFANIGFVSHPTGNILVSMSLILVAFIILLIALVNFINFSVAIAPRRIKAINTHRVLGNSPLGLRIMIVWEAIFIVMIAGLVSLGLIELISNSIISNLIATDISIFENIDTVMIMFVGAFVVGAVTGLYPAFYMTSFVPAMVLNGGKSLPKSAHLIRQFLMSFQFVISITMIIISLFISRQNIYLQNKDYGYEIGNTLVFEVSSNPDKIASELEEYPNIEGVTSSNGDLFGGDSYSSNMASKNGVNLGTYEFMRVKHDYPSVLGLDIFEGEDFVEADENHSDGYKYALLNETAKKMLNVEIGDVLGIDKIKVKGFFRDINHKSLHKPINPFAIIVQRAKWAYILTVRYDRPENLTTVINNIKETVTGINDGEESVIVTASEARSGAYQKDIDLNTLINWAALIAIFIAVIGVIGLISLESQQRIREIAIRKVNGATIFEILQMLNVKFIKLVLISYIIAVPIAWYVVDYWLSGFEYRIGMSPWIFILSGVGVTLLTIVLVTLQSYKAATTNPSQAMKY